MTRFFKSLTMERLLAVFAVAAVFAMAARAPLDTDMLWHLRAGQWMVEHRMLLRVDVFSWSRAGQPWINHSWLSQLIIYGMYRLGGDLGLTLYTAALAAIGMAFVYAASEGNTFLRALAVVLGGAAAAVFWSTRPQMMSFLLSTVIIYLLWEYRRGRDRLWLIPVVMVVWANLHGGFAIGFVLLVLATAGEGLRWFFGAIGGETLEDAELDARFRRVLRLVAVGLISAAVVSINPYGPRMLLYPFQTVGIKVLRDFIQEWAAPNFHEAQTWPFIWLLLATFVAVGVSPRRLDWRDAVMLGGTAYSALLAGRNIATFAVVATPALVYYGDAWLEQIGVRFKLNHPPRGALLAVNWLLAAAFVGAAVAKAVLADSPATLTVEREKRLPVEAVDYMESHNLPQPLFNSYNWGGYLIWAARDYPVYVDGRTDLYNDALLRDYLATYFGQPGWQERLDAIGANTVLVESGGSLSQLLAEDDAWKLEYQDAVAVVYVRRSAAGE